MRLMSIRQLPQCMLGRFPSCSDAAFHKQQFLIFFLNLNLFQIIQNISQNPRINEGFQHYKGTVALRAQHTAYTEKQTHTTEANLCSMKENTVNRKTWCRSSQHKGNRFQGAKKTKNCCTWLGHACCCHGLQLFQLSIHQWC